MESYTVELQSSMPQEPNLISVQPGAHEFRMTGNATYPREGDQIVFDIGVFRELGSGTDSIVVGQGSVEVFSDATGIGRINIDTFWKQGLDEESPQKLEVQGKLLMNEITAGRLITSINSSSCLDSTRNTDWTIFEENYFKNTGVDLKSITVDGFNRTIEIQPMTGSPECEINRKLAPTSYLNRTREP